MVNFALTIDRALDLTDDAESKLLHEILGYLKICSDYETIGSIKKAISDMVEELHSNPDNISNRSIL